MQDVLRLSLPSTHRCLRIVSYNAASRIFEPMGSNSRKERLRVEGTGSVRRTL